MVCYPQRIVRDGPQASDASSTATLVLSAVVMFQSLEASLEDRVVLIQAAEDKDTFGHLVNRLVLEDLPTLRTQITQYRSAAPLEDAVCQEIAGIPALVQYSVVRLFGDAGRATEANPDILEMSVICTVSNLLFPKTLSLPSRLA